MLISRCPKWLLLIVLGAAGALALPPWHLVFLLLPAFAGLVVVVFRAGTVRSAFIAGWWFGVGQGAAGYYWVANAFLVDQARYGFLAPVAVIGLAAGMAVFPGIATALAHAAHRFRPTAPLGRVLIFAAMWAASEWLRSWVLTGFPWNLMATVWVFSEEMIQGAAYAGAYGLGLLTVAVAALPAVFFWHGERRWAVLQTGFGALVLVGIWAAGYYRIDAPGPDDVDDVRLRLVQPNIAQHLKWKPDLRLGHVQNQLKLSRHPGKGKPPTHVIWPETSVPYNLSGDRPLRSLMATAVPPQGVLITGAPRSEKLSDGSRRVANSLHALNSAGQIIATYDKKHLVPFGEYVPFRNILKFSKLTAGRLDFTSGTGPSVFDLPGLPPFAALICYEVIFPSEVAEAATGPRPAWLLNITNDAWFGLSAGPYQHLAAAQLRAVEQGLPLIRVANTGISAVIDAKGRIRSSLVLGAAGILDAELPGAYAQPPPYGRFGDALTLLFVVVAIGGFGLLGRQENTIKTVRFS